MSLTGKSPSETYKDITYVDNNNNGVTTTLKQVKSGNGSSTALQVSDRSLQVKSATNNTAALDVQNASGTSKFLVDTTNNFVKANNVHVNTMYQEFGVFDLENTQQNYYNPLFANTNASSQSEPEGLSEIMGTGPATSLDISAVSMGSETLIGAMWYVMDNITIDAGKLFVDTDGQACDCKVFSYDIVEGDGATGGDLSNGTEIMNSGSTLSNVNNAITTAALTVTSANVSSGKVVLAMVRNTGGTNRITAKLRIKYHITG